jgi:hypothetical protein
MGNSPSHARRAVALIAGAVVLLVTAMLVTTPTSLDEASDAARDNGGAPPGAAPR